MRGRLLPSLPLFTSPIPRSSQPVPGPILAVDWAEDSRALRLNTADLELFHCEEQGVLGVGMGDDGDGAVEAVEGALLGTREARAIGAWASHRCPLAFGSTAAWPSAPESTEVVSADRRSEGGLLAVGLDSGAVRLLAYPSSQAKAAFSEGVGHAGPAAALRFLAGGARLVSGGAKDACLLQWAAGS